MEFEDSTVVVTGGTRGIGRQISEAFAERGATVAATYFERSEPAETTEERAERLPGTVTTYQLDVRDRTAVDEVFGTVEDALSEPAVLINNAGTSMSRLLTRTSIDQWNAVLETNLTGTFNCTQRAVRPMIRNGGGTVVNLGSTSAERSWMLQTAYAASKAGVEGFTRAAARELARHDVRVNCVSPGLVDTELYSTERGEERPADEDEIPLGRIADPEEIASAATFLASEEAAYVTGEVLRVDGGLLA